MVARIWTHKNKLKTKPIPVPSVADLYHVDTGPDPGSEEKIFYGSGSRTNFDTDPDPGKHDTDPDPGKKRIKHQENLKNVDTLIVYVFCVYIT